MYKVIHTYPSWEYGSKKPKLEKRNEYFYDANDAINDVRRWANEEYIVNGKSKFSGRPVDVSKSVYVEDLQNPTNTYAKVVMPTVRREAYHHERVIGGNGQMQITEISESPAVILPEETQEWKIEYYPTDPDFETAANEIIDLLTVHKDEIGLIDYRKFLDSWVTFGEDIKIIDTQYPLSIVIRQIDPNDLENKKDFVVYSSDYTRIILYKKNDTLCVRLIRGGSKTALDKNHTIESSTTWYEHMPTNHTNYAYCQENLDAILKHLTNDAKKIRKVINDRNKPPRYKNEALNNAIMLLREHYNTTRISVRQYTHWSGENIYEVSAPDLSHALLFEISKTDVNNICVGGISHPKEKIDVTHDYWKEQFIKAIDERIERFKR